MLRNEICQGGGIKCGRSDCQAVECRQYMLLEVLEQVNVKKKGRGGCGNPWKLAWPMEGIPAEVVFRDNGNNPGTAMTPGPGGLVRKRRGKNV